MRQQLEIPHYDLNEYKEMIKSALLIETFTFGPQRLMNLGDRLLIWHSLDLLGQKINLSDLEHSDNGNMFGTNEGDVVIIFINDMVYLYIDLGASDWGGPGMRKYSVLSLSSE